MKRLYFLLIITILAFIPQAEAGSPMFAGSSSFVATANNDLDMNGNAAKDTTDQDVEFGDGTAADQSITVTTLDDDAADNSKIYLRTADAGPAAIDLWDILGGVNFQGYGTSQYNTGASIRATAFESAGFTDANFGTQLEFHVADSTASSLNLVSFMNINNFVYGYNATPNIGTTANENIAMGSSVMTALTSGTKNVAIGTDAADGIINQPYNVAIGYQAASVANTAYRVGIGFNAARALGDSSIGIGRSAGRYQNDGSTALTGATDSIYLGYSARGQDNSETNAVVIGLNALGKGSNTVAIGNSSITDNYFQNNIIVTELDDLAANASTLTLRTADAGPAAVDSGDILGEVYFQGYDNDSYDTGALIQVKADANWGASERGTELIIQTRDGSGALTTALTVDAAGGVNLGSGLIVSNEDVTCASDVCAYDSDVVTTYLTSENAGAADVLTVTAGTDGQRRTFVMSVDGGDNITVDVNTGTDTTLADAGDSVTYEYDGTTTTWFIVSNYGIP